MSEQELEEQVDTGSDSNVETIETGEDNGTPDKSSNKSNFKKLSQKAKDAESRAEQAERKAQELEEELNAWRSENPELITSALSKKSDGIDKGDLALFLVTNPEAREHLEEVKEYLAEMKNPDLEKAWKYVKPTIAKESETTRDFDIKGKVKSTKVDLKSLSFEEAYSEGALTLEQRKEWRKIHNQ